MIGIVDKVLEQDDDDSLNIGNYIKALLSFIENTVTPINIGIQGEWVITHLDEHLRSSQEVCC